MPESTDELRAQIARLARENDEVKSRSKSSSTVPTSIEGLETFAMRIGPDESIVYVNTSLSMLLSRCLPRPARKALPKLRSARVLKISA